MRCFFRLKKLNTKFIKVLDVFGYDPELFVFGEKKFKTFFGGLLTLVYIVLMILMFFYLGSGMLNKENPDTNVSQLYKKNPSSSKVGREDYFFMFGMQLWRWPNGHFYDPAIYTVKMTDQNGTDLSFERCTVDHLPSDQELSEFFQTAHSSNLNDLLCLTKETNLLISGTFTDMNDFNSIHISISPCQNKTNKSNSSVVCKPEEEIIEALGKGNFAYYSIDILFDLLQRNPAKKVGLDYFIETSTSVRKQVTRFLSSSHVHEDVGWIVKDPQESSYTVFDRDRESVSLIEQKDQGKAEILYMHIRKSVYEKIYSRKYMKIQSVLALMGGFLKILHVFFIFVSRPIVQKLFHDDITNLIYNFDVSHNQSKTFKSLKSKALALKGETKQHSLKRSLARVISTLYQTEYTLFNQAFSNEKMPLRITFAEQIMSWFSKNEKLINKTRQRHKAIEKIRRKLDLTFLFEKYNEIEKIKMLLLNEEQYRLFEFLPKPRIQTDLTINYSPKNNENYRKSVHEKSFYFTEDYDNRQKAQKAEESLRKIMNKADPSDIDLKLISLLSPELKALITDEETELSKPDSPKMISEESIKILEEDICINKQYFTSND